MKFKKICFKGGKVYLPLVLFDAHLFLDVFFHKKSERYALCRSHPLWPPPSVYLESATVFSTCRLWYLISRQFSLHLLTSNKMTEKGGLVQFFKSLYYDPFRW